MKPPLFTRTIKDFVYTNAVIVAFGITALLLVTAMRMPVAQAAPFTCSSTFYQLIDERLHTLNISDGTYDPIGPTQPFETYNALGYNTEDNLLYALIVDDVADDAELVSIDDAGTVTNLGTPTGLPSGLLSLAGDFDESGNLWAYPITGGTTMYKIDVSAGTSTSETLSADPGTVRDFMYHSNSLYGINFDGVLQRVSLTTGTVNSAAVSGLASTGKYGAGWSNNNGDIYVSNTDTGKVYKITEYNTAAPVAELILNGTATNSTDGGSCYLANNPFPPIEDVSVECTTEVGSPCIFDVPDLCVNQLITAPQRGTSVFSGTKITYTPNSNTADQERYTYLRRSSQGQTANCFVTINFIPKVPDAGDEPTSSKPLAGIVAAVSGTMATVFSYSRWRQHR